MYEDMEQDELVRCYNETAKPNVYGAELLRRVFEADAVAFGMHAGNPALRS